MECRSTSQKRHSIPWASTRKKMCGEWKRFCACRDLALPRLLLAETRQAASLREFRYDFRNCTRVSMRLRPGYSGGDSLYDCRMRMEKPLDPARRRFFGEILLGQLIHRRHKGLDAGHGLEAIAIGLPLVEA